LAKTTRTAALSNGSGQEDSNESSGENQRLNGDDGHQREHDNVPVLDLPDAEGMDDEYEGVEEEEEQGGTDSTDDPVRMYLMQMGQIPLLDRSEEIASAKEIERARRCYRTSMLANDYMLQGAVNAL
jgi:RNA polymerase primary sigma factor